MLLTKEPAPITAFIKEKFAIKLKFIFKFSEIFIIVKFIIEPIIESKRYKIIIFINSLLFLKIFLMTDVRLELCN
ncbi:hypothetical protein YN1HA_9270 [Sulfurisphaera ohwakuensis]